MPGRWITELREHLDLAQSNRLWLKLKDSITNIIEAHFEISLSAPVGSKQPVALKRTMDQVYRDLSKFFPRYRRSDDEVFLQHFIYERVTQLRQVVKKRLETRSRQPNPRKERAQKPKNPVVRFETPSVEDVPFRMVLRSQVKKRISARIEHSSISPRSDEDDEMDEEPIQSPVEPTTQRQPSASAPPLVQFLRQNKTNKLTTFPMSPSMIRAKNWVPPSQRILGLNDQLHSNMRVRASPRTSLRHGVDALSPLTDLSTGERLSTPNRLSTPLTPRQRAKSDLHTQGTHRHSPIIPSRLRLRDSQPLHPSPTPRDNDLLVFLKRESLSQLYPYLKREGWNMEVVHFFSNLEMDVIYAALELVFRKIPREVRFRAQYDGEGRKATRLENAYWQILAAKIYSLSHGGK